MVVERCAVLCAALPPGDPLPEALLQAVGALCAAVGGGTQIRVTLGPRDAQAWDGYTHRAGLAETRCLPSLTGPPIWIGYGAESRVEVWP